MHARNSKEEISFYEDSKDLSIFDQMTNLTQKTESKLTWLISRSFKNKMETSNSVQKNSDIYLSRAWSDTGVSDYTF